MQTEAIIVRLQSCVDDPMWANHAEISKTTCAMAIQRLQQFSKALEEIAESTDSYWQQHRAILALEGLK